MYKSLLAVFIAIVAVVGLFEFLFWFHRSAYTTLQGEAHGISTLTIWAAVLTVVFLVFAVIGLLNIDNRIKELNSLKEDVANTVRSMKDSLSEIKNSANEERQKIVTAAEKELRNLITQSVDFQTLHDLLTQINSFPNPVERIKHYTDLLHCELNINNINKCLILSRRGEANEQL